MNDDRIPFDRRTEARIQSASRWGFIAAVSSAAAGLIDVAIKLIDSYSFSIAPVLVGAPITLTITFVLAIYLYQASIAFRKVATTDEADTLYLFEGFEKLRLHFKILGILAFIGIALVALMLFGFLMCRLAL